ncbi:hypothetical protein SAFG77S_03707 [Streptomyces afghaniensis]
MRRPGRGDGRGTGRSSGSSGTDGFRRNAGISPTIPRGRSPTSWYCSERRDMRWSRDLLGLLDRTSPSRTVTDRPRCAELVKGLAGQLVGVLQLGLTGGPYRSYVLNVRPFGAAHRREAPGCSPVIGGFVLSSYCFPGAARRQVLTLGHRAGVCRIRSHLAERLVRHPTGPPPPRVRCPRCDLRTVASRTSQLRSVAQRFEQGSRLGDGSLAYRRGHGSWGT